MSKKQKAIYVKGHGRARVLCKLKQPNVAVIHLMKTAGLTSKEAKDYIDSNFFNKTFGSKPTRGAILGEELRQRHQKANKDKLYGREAGFAPVLEYIANKISGTEAQVCFDIAKRQQHGIKKYGKTVADNPLTETQWLQHAYEEALDLSIYLKRLITLKTDIEKDMEDRVNERNEGV